MKVGDVMVKLSGFAATHVGEIRRNNEDNYYINGQYKKEMDALTDACQNDSDYGRYLCAVCDGMGGEAFGETAAFIAVKTLDKYLNTDFRKKSDEYIEKANKLICDEIEKNDGARIGTTLALLYIQNETAVAYNVGDSRIYLYRKNKLRQLSEDHNQTQRLVRLGLLKQSDARNHKDKHKLTQHLGIFPEELIIEPYISQEISIKQGDIFLLCSDGLTDMLTDEEIAEFLKQEKDIKKKGEDLIQAALQHGGKDNVTVVLVKAEEIKNNKSIWNRLF